MYEWQKQIQMIVNEIDRCILNHNDEALMLENLSLQLGYSKFYTTRKFKEITGMSFRDYLRMRRLAFALKEVRDSDRHILDIAVDYGFSSHEAFTRAFKRMYGSTPHAYRIKPEPVVLRTKVNAFDRYSFGLDEIGMVKSDGDVAIYFVTIPAHKFLCVINRESNGYWDFWQKQNNIPEQDQETICGLLDSIKGKLDDHGGSECNSDGGQIMAYMNDADGRLCDWGIMRSECYGVRLPLRYKGDVPSQMQIIDVAQGEYIVFEHGPFDYEQEKGSVEDKVERAMASFDYDATPYCLDTVQGRMVYFYFNPQQHWKYIRPVRKRKQDDIHARTHTERRGESG